MSGEMLAPVLQEASSPRAEVRLRAAAALADHGGREAETALAGLLADPDHRVRTRAAEALSRGTREIARAACVAIMRDAGSGVAGIAAAGALAARPGGGLDLLAALEDPSPVVRLRAARELPGPAPGPESVDGLVAAAGEEEDPDVHAALLVALGRTGRSEAAPALLRVLRDGTPFLRAHAAWALGLLGDAQSATRLLPALDEPGLEPCILAALARVPSPEAAEELARRAAKGRSSDLLLLALARGVAAGSPATARRVRALWPAVAEAAQGLLARSGAGEQAAGAMARLLARLDAPGAAALIVREGPFPEGYGALADLPPERLTEAIRTALVVDDAEPALTLLIHGGAGVEAAALLAHPSARARVAALNRLPAGATPLPDLLEILADDSAETALAAAWALAREARPAGSERARAAHAALHDRASGPDGPGRAAALVALREWTAAPVDVTIRAALASHDPSVRAAAASVVAFRPELGERDLTSLLDDEDPGVRTEALGGLARLARARTLKIEPRTLMRFLNDEACVAAGAGTLLVTLAADERPRIARDMLAHRGAVRRAALEAIQDVGDSGAATAVTFAVVHEDVSTARAVLAAASVAPPPVAAAAVAHGFLDRRAEVRIAAASVAAGAGDDLAEALAIRLAEALDRETDAETRAALLRAVGAAGRADAIPAVTRALGLEANQPEALLAARSLARRFPEAVRAAWAAAPPRAGRAWGDAIQAAPRTVPAVSEDEADAVRLLAGLARRRTHLGLDGDALRPRIGLLLAADAWAAGSFRVLWRRLRDLPPSHPVFARLVDAVADVSSRFFADRPALDALADEIAPERLLSLGADGVLEVWCAGCGTGEEVWSAAIRLAEAGHVPGRRVRLRGTDLSPGAIRHARAGIYGPHALRGVPDTLRARYFQALSNGRFRVRDFLREGLFFEVRALADEPAGAGKHDAIVCHGVLRQLPAADRRAAVERLGASLKPGGYLLLGREDHDAAAAAPLAPVLLGRDLAYRAPGAVVYTRALS